MNLMFLDLCGQRLRVNSRLARLVYRMLKYGQHYVDQGAEYYEQRNRQQQIEFLRKKAAKLSLQVTPAHA